MILSLQWRGYPKCRGLSVLVSIRSKCLNENISAHINVLDGPVKQLKGKDKMLEYFVAIGILVTSINVADILPITQSIKTLSKDGIKWKDITSCPIKKAKLLSSNSGAGTQANSTM